MYFWLIESYSSRLLPRINWEGYEYTSIYHLSIIIYKLCDLLYSSKDFKITWWLSDAEKLISVNYRTLIHFILSPTDTYLVVLCTYIHLHHKYLYIHRVDRDYVLRKQVQAENLMYRGTIISSYDYTISNKYWIKLILIIKNIKNYY